ncbi:uncharacterized protein LOC126235986 isoform X6 [Schistocerca nitens]|uniref:uncharacterized protein LOC126235986 isoform X4 n=1 Tax=Schistocerca nitens TaxID=7011 RepID=UPI0021175980|nr:uncharacterized protein LOC126235986 isoform X4 [Schistocerca nitens]XP_049800931.1 uncharacterized protein LOC126235986 isoform X5 [Schistocerca nitens]XP_049800932.1 uncharacterized protein LOC126235986 isoform X6 [Schistocerca nitens]
MLRHALALLLIAAVGSASYPKITVLFQDPADYADEMKCCMGAFNTPHNYTGAYQVNALYLSSHVRNYATLEIGPEQQNIRITMSETPYGVSDWKVVATATYSEVAEPLQLLRVPISYKTDPSKYYLFEISYGGSYTYPTYSSIDISAGPYKTSYNAFILGIDYEKA